MTIHNQWNGKKIIAQANRDMPNIFIQKENK
uniref:Uncharacterized protein n=1 Tax=Arundo donax TaxID=35708 RepID=A0A0A9G3D5_ARUDO